MDEYYLLAATRYVELNPVHANMVDRAEDYAWSSTKAHLAGKDDALVKVAPMLERVTDWQEYLSGGIDDMTVEALRMHSKTGRPLGDESFLDMLEHQVGKVLRPLNKGRKKRVD